MMEKIKNFYGSHPIRWTLLTLVIIVAAALLIWYAPAFSLQAEALPVHEVTETVKGEKIPMETAVSNNKVSRKGVPVVVAEKAGRTLTYDPVEMIFTLTDEAGNTVYKKYEATKGVIMATGYHGTAKDIMMEIGVEEAMRGRIAMEAEIADDEEFEE